MWQVLKSLWVIAAGAGLALVLAWAAFLVGFFPIGTEPADWDPVLGTRLVLANLVVFLVHLLWIVTWWVSTRLGWVRFVAAALLVPVGGFMGWGVMWTAWSISTGAGQGWALGPQLLTSAPDGIMSPLVWAILAPAVVVALSVLVTVRVTPRDSSQSMFVNPAWELRTVVRFLAIAGVVLGSIILAAILTLQLLAMSGLI